MPSKIIKKLVNRNCENRDIRASNHHQVPILDGVTRSASPWQRNVNVHRMWPSKTGLQAWKDWLIFRWRWRPIGKASFWVHTRWCRHDFIRPSNLAVISDISGTKYLIWTRPLNSSRRFEHEHNFCKLDLQIFEYWAELCKDRSFASNQRSTWKTMNQTWVRFYGPESMEWIHSSSSRLKNLVIKICCKFLLQFSFGISKE